MSDDEQAYTLLAMAERLQNHQPPKHIMAIKCAMAALNGNLSKEMEAHCHLQLGKLTLYHVFDYVSAKKHLELSYYSTEKLGDFLILKRLEALCLLCDLYLHSRLWPMDSIIVLIKKELPKSMQYPTIYHKLMFSLIEATKVEGSAKLSIDVCDMAIKNFKDDNNVMVLYYRATKIYLSCLFYRCEDDGEIKKIKEWMKNHGDKPELAFHVKNIKGYILCTKIAFLLSEGMSRSARPVIRNLQQMVSEPVKEAPLPGIRWMDEMGMTVFACLMNVASGLIQCNYDRAKKYHDLCNKHADDILIKYARNAPEFAVVRSITQMKMTSYQLMSIFNIMACRPDDGLNNIHDMIRFGIQSGDDYVLKYFEPNIHYCLGLLCSYLRKDDEAAEHFKAAINPIIYRDNPNFLHMLNINLAFSYLNQLKFVEYVDVSTQLSPARLVDCSTIVKANGKLLTAMYYYLKGKTAESKTLLHEVLQESKSEDFFRLHGLALLLLSLLTNVDEACIKPTVDWSKKGQDHVVAVWSHTLYTGFLRHRHADATNAIEQIQTSKELLDKENMLNKAMQSPVYNLIYWKEGSCSSCLSKDDLP